MAFEFNVRSLGKENKPVAEVKMYARVEEDRDGYIVHVMQHTITQVPKSLVNNRPELALLKGLEYHRVAADTAYMNYASHFSPVSVEERTRISGGLGGLFKIEREKCQRRESFLL